MKRAFTVSEILGLSENEKEVLELLPEHATPLSLARAASIPRPTVYITLKKLEARGLVRQKKEGKRHYWTPHLPKDILQDLAHCKMHIAEEEERAEHMLLSDDTSVRIHKGKDAIVSVLMRMIKHNGGARMICIQGNHVGGSWGKALDPREINRINNMIKERKVITEIVTSLNWFKLQANMFGNDWIKGFEGRTSKINLVADEYLDYESQIFLSGKSAYIFHMPEETAIEISNASIVKMLRSMIVFAQDNSKTVDGNAILRQLLENRKGR